MAHSDKRIKRAVDTQGTKSALVSQKPGGYYSLPPVFSFRKYDGGAPWAIPTSRISTDSVFINLRGLEYTKWADIMQASGGRRHGANSHLIPVEKLSKEARDRANEIALQESELFSLRLQGTVRLWGIIEPDGVFFVIWFDPNHQVYPVG